MEIDLAQLDNSAAGSDLFRAEICIVGGGIAGLTLAHELERFGHDVLLLEAGDSSAGANPRVDEVLQTGRPHLGTTERIPGALGGSSLVWGGQLLPLPDDATWPVSSEELSPYSRRAERLLGVDDLPYDISRFFEERRKPMPPVLNGLADLNCLLSKFAPFSHRNLAHTIGRSLRKRSHVRLVVHARAVELLLAPSGDHIQGVLVRSASGRMHRIEAAQTVLAAGTIESVRLLLASRSVISEGIGNAHDQVGRNFHDHLTVTAATLRGQVRQQLLSLHPWIHGGTMHALKLAAVAQLRQRLRLNPVLAHLTIEEPVDGGIAAIRDWLRARQREGTAKTVDPAQISQAVGGAALLLLSAKFRHRRYVSPRATVQLRVNVAQQSPSASRIVLTQDGQPVLDWKIDESERSSLRTFSQYLRQHLGANNIDWNPSLFEPLASAPIPELDDARHPMGGACMGVDPRSSVVDTNLRVHGLNNLFVASAAVFPDGSPQLPTLPLMALTLRLAEHLHRCI
ncbi:MAG TPA: GMC family oxidoreductase [Candidatus Aquilonibacter sp.]|nr:GMC family oxidoreductase [Candidatus Aquilonibacter sp.]